MIAKGDTPKIVKAHGIGYSVWRYNTKQERKTLGGQKHTNEVLFSPSHSQSRGSVTVIMRSHSMIKMIDEYLLIKLHAKADTPEIAKARISCSVW